MSICHFDFPEDEESYLNVDEDRIGASIYEFN